MAAWTTRDIPSQAGRRAIVTGANSGIGWEAALELARAGADVVVAARDAGKGEDAVRRIRAQVPDAKARFEALDLASLASVRAFAGRVSGEPLDLLVNNAGVMNVPTRELTVDGFERQFGTNHLGHFALTLLLVPALRRARAPRVTTISSGAAQMGTGRINFDDPSWDAGYTPWKAYCQSKLANLFFMEELARRGADETTPLVSNAAHPGFSRTNLASGSGKPPGAAIVFVSRFVSQDAAHGALPTLRAATAPDAVSRDYFGPGGFLGFKGDPERVALPPNAKDDGAARRLWGVSEKLTGVAWPA